MNHLNSFWQPHQNICKSPYIAYAKTKRWQKPEAHNHWEIFSKPQKTYVAPQKQSDFLNRMLGKLNAENFIVEEDFQHLQIYAPKNISQLSNLPIVVWLHGGSYELGCPNLPTSDPSLWIETHQLIFISIRYRLGIFGFLGQNKSKTANLGVLDVIEALKWIQKNISTFGGNPKNVTLLGQSSGGDLATHLILVENSEQWFQKVIIHSAPLGISENKQKMSQEMLQKTSFFDKNHDALKLIDDFEKVKPSVFNHGLKAVMPFGIQYGFEPFSFSENSLKKRWSQRAIYFDVLIGTNQQETALYLKTSNLCKKINRTLCGKLVLDYLISKTTKIIYQKPAKEFAELLKNKNNSVYLFQLINFDESNTLGACHCFELPLLFHHSKHWKGAELIQNLNPDKLFEKAKKLQAIWTVFIKSSKIATNENYSDFLNLKSAELTDDGRVRFEEL